MPQVIDKPRTTGPGNSLGDSWKVIVLNDNHNTFDGVAGALSSVLPGVSFDRGMEMAMRIHNEGSHVVWTGMKEHAELYWQMLESRNLTMAPLQS